MYSHHHVPRFVDAGSHPEQTRSICHRCHGFDAIHDQVQQDLLQLNAISKHVRESLRQLTLEQDSIVVKLTASQSQDLLNDLVYIQFVSFRRASS